MLSDQKDGDAHCGMFFFPLLGNVLIFIVRMKGIQIVRLIITAFVLCIVISHPNSKDTTCMFSYSYTPRINVDFHMKEGTLTRFTPPFLTPFASVVTMGGTY